MSKRLKLQRAEAEVILRTNEKNIDATTKRLLQKVVDKRPLSEEEIGEIEGIVANAQLQVQINTGDFQDDPVDQAPPDKESEAELEAVRKREAKKERVIARRQLVFEMRCQHPPVTVREICKRLSISMDTCMSDIQAIKLTHQQVLSETGENLAKLGGTVAQYDLIFRKAMTLSDAYTSPMAKAAMMRTALTALDGKTRLMGDTGIILRVPERQEILVAHADAGTVRERAAKLMQAQEQRTSNTIELPRIENKSRTELDDAIDAEADEVETT
jgi:hypothetical protein